MELYNALPLELKRYTEEFIGYDLNIIQLLKKIKRLQFLVKQINIKKPEGLVMYKKICKSLFQLTNKVNKQKLNQLTCCCCRPIEYRETIQCPQGHHICKNRRPTKSPTVYNIYTKNIYSCRICIKQFNHKKYTNLPPSLISYMNE